MRRNQGCQRADDRRNSDGARAAHQQDAGDFEAFKRRIEATHESTIFLDSPPHDKLHTALQALVDPYLDAMATHDGLVKLFRVAVAAWNLALVPLDQRSDAFDRELGRLLPGGSDDDVEILRRFIEDLIGQKTLLFPSARRWIIDFELLERGNERPYLQVAARRI